MTRYKIIWYSEALEDLESIYKYYFDKSPRVADDMYNSIVAETRYLKEFPYIAPIEPYLEDKELEFRSLVTKDGLFKIIYFVADFIIVIYRVWDCRQDPDKLKS